MLVKKPTKFTTEMLHRGKVTLHCGARSDVMESMKADSVDLIGTILPDQRIPRWTEELRILKPGGYLIAVGLPTTSYGLGFAIEHAGFEIREESTWTPTPERPGTVASPSDVIFLAQKPSFNKAASRGEDGSGSFADLPRPPSEDPGENHPKEFVDCIQSLVKRLTPPGGTVLDPHCGHGSIAKAALREGCSVILIAEDEEHRNDVRRWFAAEQWGVTDRAERVVQCMRRGKDEVAQYGYPSEKFKRALTRLVLEFDMDFVCEQACDKFQQGGIACRDGSCAARHFWDGDGCRDRCRWFIERYLSPP